MKIYGKRIKAVRILKGLTLKEVAAHIGVEEATIQRYESGQIKSIPHSKLIALAEALETSVEYLLGIGDNNERGADQFVEWMLAPSETAGGNIKRLREARGFDVEELAKKTGVSRQTIYRYESGKVDNASPRILKRLSDVLHTSIAYILGKIDDPNDISPSSLSIHQIYCTWAQDSYTPSNSEGGVTTNHLTNKRADPSERNFRVFTPDTSNEKNHSGTQTEQDRADARLLELAHQICLATPAKDSKDSDGFISPERIDVVTNFVADNERSLKALIASVGEQENFNDNE